MRIGSLLIKRKTMRRLVDENAM
jgi:hypothetical protein